MDQPQKWKVGESRNQNWPEIMEQFMGDGKRQKCNNQLAKRNIALSDLLSTHVFIGYAQGLMRRRWLAIAKIMEDITVTYCYICY